MNYDFSHLIQTIEKGGKTIAAAQWAAGDEVVRLVGRHGDANPVEAKACIEAAAAALKARGLDYTAGTLRARWKLSSAFGKNRRHLEWSYGVHADAKDPDVLDAIVARAPKGQAIVQAYVREIMNARKVAARRALEAEKARREAKRAEAEKAKKAAEARARKAANAAEREAAEEVAAIAEKAMRDNAVPPTRADISIEHPTNEELPALLAGHRLARDLANAKVVIGKLEADYAPHIGELTDNEREATIHDLKAIAELARHFADRLRKGSIKAAHLSVVA